MARAVGSTPKVLDLMVPRTALVGGRLRKFLSVLFFFGGAKCKGRKLERQIDQNGAK